MASPAAHQSSNADTSKSCTEPLSSSSSWTFIEKRQIPGLDPITEGRYPLPPPTNPLYVGENANGAAAAAAYPDPPLISPLAKQKSWTVLEIEPPEADLDCGACNERDRPLVLFDSDKGYYYSMFKHIKQYCVMRSKGLILSVGRAIFRSLRVRKRENTDTAAQIY